MKNEKQKITYRQFALLLIALACLFSQSSFAQKPIYGKGWTIIDTTGRIYATALDFENIYDFHEGAAIAQSRSGPFCLIDHYGFRISKEFQELDYIGEGIFRFKEDNRYGLIDTKGRNILTAKYEWIGEFQNGLVPVSQDEVAGYIDKEGETALPFVYENVTSFNKGVAAVKKDGLFGIIDPEGEMVVPFKYPYLGKFSHGLAPCSEDKQFYGFVDKQGSMVLPPRFTYAEPFDDRGYARVSVSPPLIGDFGRRDFPYKFFIDLNGQRVDSLQVAPVDKTSGYILKIDPSSNALNTFWNIYDQNGQLIFDNLFRDSRAEGINDFSEDGYAAVNIENRKSIRPDISGLSPWGKYTLNCSRAYGSQATHELIFEKLKEPLRIREENEFSFTVLMGQWGYEYIKVLYKIQKGSINLVQVDQGREFFRPEEITFQEAYGMGFYDAVDALRVVVDQFFLLLKPHLIFQPAGPGSIELKRGGTIWVNGTFKPALDANEKIQYPDGANYQGEMKGDDPEGWGYMTRPGGNIYFGKFVEGIEEGFGIFRLKDGTTLKGTFKNGKPEGKILFKKPDGQIEWLTYENGEVVSTEVLRQRPDFVGIGLTFNFDPGKRGFIVEQVTENLPAYEAGIRPGDRLVRVDGTTLIGRDNRKVEELLAGPEGSVVKVIIEQEGAQKEFTLTREAE